MKGPQFTTVVKEIVDRLVNGDWLRLRSVDGKRFYYIVGEDAWKDDESSGDTYGVTSEGEQEYTKLGKHFAKEAIADSVPVEEQISQAESNLRRNGIDPSAAREYLARRISFSEVEIDFSYPDPLGAWVDFLEVHLLSKAARGNLSIDVSKEVEMGREKFHLRELAERYRKIVKRARRLDRLSVRDSQLAEASRCYLYGFHRASIVMAAAALERHLKQVTGIEFIKHYEDLVTTARNQKLLGRDDALKVASMKVFNLRTEVVHKDLRANHATAQKVLDLARKVIEHLSSGQATGRVG